MRKREKQTTKLVINNKVVTDEKDIVNGLNNYFCSIGQILRIELTYQISKFSYSIIFHVLLSW